MLQDKKDEMRPPKTKLNSRDRSKESRSISSPRLKSFPAEKIKRLDNPPTFSSEPIGALIVRQNPQKTGTFLMDSFAESNNGRGDATSVQLTPMHQQLQLSNISNTSQQQVTANHQQIAQTNPHSESLLTHRIASPERQTHRPLTPSVIQGAMIRDRSPRKPPTITSEPVIVQNPATQDMTRTSVAMPQMRQLSSDSQADVDQNRNETFTRDAECERQPIGGRNAANHRQMIAQMQQQKQTQATIVRDANASPNNRFDSSNCQDTHHAQSHDPFPRISQQSYQQSQHDMYRQCMSQQALDRMQSISNQHQQVHNNPATYYNYYNQQLSAMQLPGQGMTSPQDMTVNQMRLMQRNSAGHQQNFRYPINLQSTWSQNNRLAPVTNFNRHYLQQSPWQYYYQAQDTSNSNFNQQTNQSQAVSLNQINNKSNNQQLIAEAHNRQGSEKILQFTPDMIRDQELLVSTMRQQGISDEVMRRQFDALLNEQRRHLAYVAQFRQQEDTPEVKGTYRLAARRRTERDEKPEWMMHITPPRISYSEVERMKMQQRVTEGQCPKDDRSLKEVSGTVSARQQDYHQQQKEETIDQTISPRQIYFPMNPHQLWQQRTANWSYGSDHQSPCSCAACYPCAHQRNISNNIYIQPNPQFNGSNQQRNFCQYPYEVPCNPYYVHPECQKTWFKDCNANPPNAINRRVSMDFARLYEQTNKPTEPSSLMKMRIYKEIIRPQKRNNGLQNPDTIQRKLEALKDPASKRGLEYLANLTRKKPAIRLNGTQEAGEIPDDMQLRPAPTETISQIRKWIPANGLENSRNPDNPPPCVLRPKRADEPAMMEYPRQRRDPRTCYSARVEGQNGAMTISQPREYAAAAISHAQNAESFWRDRQNVPTAQGHHGDDTAIFQYGGAPHYHQAQQCYLNGQNFTCLNGGQGDVASMQRPDVPGAMRIDRAGGDTGENSRTEEETTKYTSGEQSMPTMNAYGQPEIHEARTIGSITYLARKPNYAPSNKLIVSPDKLIANRHLQPPMIF